MYFSSFAYGTYLSELQPYITVNCTTLYNGSNSQPTLQAYGGATGAGYNSIIIVNGGGGTRGGNISFLMIIHQDVILIGREIFYTKQDA